MQQLFSCNEEKELLIFAPGKMLPTQQCIMEHKESLTWQRNKEWIFQVKKKPLQNLFCITAHTQIFIAYKIFQLKDEA